MASSRAALSVRSMPCRAPLPAKLGSGGGVARDRDVLVSSNASRRACSSNLRRVRLCCAAYALAARNSSSLMSTVVLMHKSITFDMSICLPIWHCGSISPRTGKGGRFVPVCGRTPGDICSPALATDDRDDMARKKMPGRTRAEGMPGLAAAQSSGSVRSEPAFMSGTSSLRPSALRAMSAAALKPSRMSIGVARRSCSMNTRPLFQSLT